MSSKTKLDLQNKVTEVAILNAYLKNDNKKKFIPKRYLSKVFKEMKQRLLKYSQKNGINPFHSFSDSDVIYTIDSEFEYFVNVLEYNRHEMRGKNHEEFMDSTFNIIIEREQFRHFRSFHKNHYLVSPLSRFYNNIHKVTYTISSMYDELDEYFTTILALFNRAGECTQSIYNVISEGFAKDAYILWRSLHEIQCNLILFNDCSEIVISKYVKSEKYEWLDDAMNELKRTDIQRKVFINGVQKLANRDGYKEAHKTASKYVHPTIHTIEDVNNFLMENHILYLVFFSLYDIYGIIIDLLKHLSITNETKKLKINDLLNSLKRDLERVEILIPVLDKAAHPEE